MSILPIAPISVGALLPGNLTATSGASPTGAAGSTGGGGFASALTNALDSLSASQANADQLALQAATGDLKSIQDYTIAATEAQLQTQLVVTVRNKALEAFNDIMKMQI